MSARAPLRAVIFSALATATTLVALPAWAGLVDRNVAVSTTGDGIAMTYEQEIGAGRGDVMTIDSSMFIIQRDPFRAIRRGRQLLQRKFTRAQGQGPLYNDGEGNIDVDLALGAGLSDSCAA
jgi:hypothetical protein